MAKQPTRTIDSVSTSIRIIELLQEKNKSGVTELASSLDQTKSTVHSHLTTLKESGWVVKDRSEYRLSLRFLDIGKHVRNQFGNYEILSSELEQLAEETGEVAQFGIEEHGRISYLYKANGNSGVETASSPGTQQAIHSTALGKAILAHLPEEDVDRFLNQHGLPQKTQYTIVDRAELRNELEKTRERGYAIDNEENVLGLRCMAAPVMNDDEIFGAVSISGPSSRVNDKMTSIDLPTLLMKTANVIELNSKFSNY